MGAKVSSRCVGEHADKGTPSDAAEHEKGGAAQSVQAIRSRGHLPCTPPHGRTDMLTPAVASSASGAS